MFMLEAFLNEFRQNNYTCFVFVASCKSVECGDGMCDTNIVEYMAQMPFPPAMPLGSSLQERKKMKATNHALIMGILVIF
jgi:hypothetical protein